MGTNESVLSDLLRLYLLSVKYVNIPKTYLYYEKTEKVIAHAFRSTEKIPARTFTLNLAGAWQKSLIPFPS